MNILNELKGLKLSNINRVSWTLKIDFSSDTGKTVCVHSQGSLLRIFKDGQMIVSSEDMFYKGVEFEKQGRKRFSCDYVGITLFDDEIAENLSDLKGVEVESANFIGTDVFINLKNNVIINILPYTLKKGIENYRIFVKDDLNSFFIVKNE